MKNLANFLDKISLIFYPYRYGKIRDTYSYSYVEIPGGFAKNLEP